MSLYVLLNPYTTGNYAFGMKSYAKNEESKHMGEMRRCSACGEIIGLREWLPSFQIKLLRGVKTNKPADIIWGVYRDFMTSERFRKVWTETKLKGIVEWRNVKIVIKKPLQMKYYYPLFKPATARPDFNKTKVAWRKHNPPLCPVCMWSDHEAIKGVFFVTETIPGDDLFHSLGLNEIFASERFKNAMEQAGITGIELIQADKYEYDVRPLSRLGPF